jgi:transcriptional regulator with XRE-family HTH domain
MTTNQMRLVKRLKARRHDLGLSQVKLAQKSGLAREYIARLELGQQDPSLSTLAKLAKALKVTVAELVK